MSAYYLPVMTYVCDRFSDTHYKYYRYLGEESVGEGDSA